MEFKADKSFFIDRIRIGRKEYKKDTWTKGSDEALIRGVEVIWAEQYLQNSTNSGSNNSTNIAKSMT